MNRCYRCSSGRLTLVSKHAEYNVYECNDCGYKSKVPRWR